MKLRLFIICSILNRPRSTIYASARLTQRKKRHLKKEEKDIARQPIISKLDCSFACCLITKENYEEKKNNIKGAAETNERKQMNSWSGVFHYCLQTGEKKRWQTTASAKQENKNYNCFILCILT